MASLTIGLIRIAVSRHKVLVSCPLTCGTPSVRALFSTNTVCNAGQKWRLQHGLPRSGNEYGPLVDLPDWTYSDGNKAKDGRRQIRRDKKHKSISARIKKLLNELPS